jgi:hypothetical protein
MAGRQRDHERLVVQRPDHQAVGNGSAMMAASISPCLSSSQLQRVVLLQHQRHLRHALDHLLDERRQQVRPDRVDHAEPQRADQRVLALLGDLLDREGLLEHALRLRDDLVADRRHAHFARAALEDLHVELVFQLLDRHRQRRLAHEARFGRAAEMPLARHRDDVLQFGQGHCGSIRCMR